MKNTLVSATLSVAALSGCAASVEETEDAPQQVTEWGAAEQAPISWEQFRDSATRDPVGGFVVDNDIAIRDEEALFDYYQSWFSSPSALTVSQTPMGADDIWGFPARFTLSFCIDSGAFGENFDEVESAILNAAQSWSSRAALLFEYRSGDNDDCDSSNTNVTFDVQPASAGLYFAKAFYPSEPRAGRTLWIDDMAFTTSSGGRDLEGILRHELGHALGFRHEHIWLTPSCTAEGTAGARAVTVYDVNSVMHYPQCRPSGAGGYRQTDDDYRGAIALYGLAPALIAVL